MGIVDDANMYANKENVNDCFTAIDDGHEGKPLWKEGMNAKLYQRIE